MSMATRGNSLNAFALGARQGRTPEIVMEDDYDKAITREYREYIASTIPRAAYLAAPETLRRSNR
jgi:hypothetical protein